MSLSKADKNVEFIGPVAITPDWHDKPTGPGEWFSVIKGGMDFVNLTAYSDGSFCAYNPPGSRWFGPIPPDPKGTT